MYKIIAKNWKIYEEKRGLTSSYVLEFQTVNNEFSEKLNYQISAFPKLLFLSYVGQRGVNIKTTFPCICSSFEQVSTNSFTYKIA